MDTVVLLSLVVACLLTSFLCSVSEAALFAVPAAAVRHEVESKQSGSAKALATLKDDISAPISALLIINTVANTAGPAVAGALVRELFGANGLIVFTIVMSGLVLIFGEVLPKFLGVTHARSVALFIAQPVSMLIVILKPAIRLISSVTARFEPEHEGPAVSHEEVLSMAAIGHQEGTIDPLEGQVISNVIGLDRVKVRDLVTPRMSVFKLSEHLTIGSQRDALSTWEYTRIPVYEEQEPDHLTGYIRQRDILRALIRGEETITLGSLKRPLVAVPELMRADKLLLRMFEQGEHLYSVVDEHGTLVGIISMEDVLEHVVGREIHDEYDR